MKEYTPYVYKMTLKKGEEVYYYVGSRSSKAKMVNPKEFLNGDYNTTSEVVHKMLEEGSWEVERTILETFSGDTSGAMECCKREGELLRELNAKGSNIYLNDNNGGANPKSHSDEFRSKMSGIVKGRKMSQEAKDKISKARKGVPNLKLQGRTLSEETKRKMSKAQQGKTYTKEERQARSETLSQPFTLVVELPSGEELREDFKSSTTFREKYGVSCVKVAKMRKGEEFVIKVVYKTSRHPWPKGTKLTIVEKVK